MCQRRNRLLHSFFAKNYACHTEKEKERKKFHQNPKCSLVHTDCTLNESTKHAEVASAFPHCDSASQFQPVAAISIPENLPLPFGGNDLLENPIAFPFSLYIPTPRGLQIRKDSTVSDRSYAAISTVCEYSLWYMSCIIRVGSQVNVLKAAHFDSLKDLLAIEAPIYLAKYCIIWKDVLFLLEKIHFHFAKNFLQRC